MEQWNAICDYHSKFYSQPEQSVQKLWENIFLEVFSYSKLQNEIDTQRKLYLGSTERLIPDIILKDSTKDLCIIELKQHNFQYIKGQKLQLFSYLKQIKLDIGILICDRIVLFNYDYAKNDDKQEEYEIHFTKDNPDGKKFVELFTKPNFNKDLIKDFITNGNKKKSNIEKIKNEISEDLMSFLLYEHFSENYSSEEIEEALKDYKFDVRKIGSEKNHSIKTDNVFARDNKDDLLPQISTEIQFIPSDEIVFKKRLLEKKEAKRTWIYSDGKEENEIWKAKKFKIESNLRGNITSTNKWREKSALGIVKVILEV